MGKHYGAVCSTVVLQQGFKSTICVVFAYPTRICVVFIQALQLPPTVTKTCSQWLTVIVIGVNLSVSGCLSLSVSHVTD